MQSTSLAARFDPRQLAALSGLEFRARYVVEGYLAGVHRSPFHGFSVEFSDYRDYQPGDDLKHVDWRLYARTDRLYVKRYLQETNVRFYLLCDTSASMLYQGGAAATTKLEFAKVLAAALTWFLLRQNDAAGLLTTGDGNQAPLLVRPSQRSTQFGLILRHLEALQAAGGNCLDRLLSDASRLVHRRSALLVFSDLLEPAGDIERRLKQLRFEGHEILVFQVLDRDEVEFPFESDQVFEDLETGARRVVSPGAIRERYRARFDEFMGEWERSLRAMEIPCCKMRTDGNPFEALALFLAERRRRL